MEFVVIAQYGHFTTWLKGGVLPRLAERTRLDLVPLGS